MFEFIYKIAAYLKSLKSYFYWKRNYLSNQKSTNKNNYGPIATENNGYIEAYTKTVVNNNYFSQPSSVGQSDIALSFVYPKSPALVLINQSPVIAKDIKWTVVLWNMDLPDRNDPLPIPVSTFDWIRPNSEGGPQNIFSSPTVESLLSPGNRLFGSASVCSPESIRGRTYIVYIVWGKNGWYAEVENEKSGKILIPHNFSKDNRDEYFRTLETLAPVQLRIPINNK